MSDKRKLDPTILREYDIRGIVGETLNVAEVRSLARGFGSGGGCAGACRGGGVRPAARQDLLRWV